MVKGRGGKRKGSRGMSLPGSGETPVARVYVDGVKTVTLKGNDIAGEFQRIVEQYVIEHYSEAARAPGEARAKDAAHA